jgi:hypothetical protein
MIMNKSSIVLDEEHYSQVLRLTWQLVLDSNEELSACAGNERSLLNRSHVVFVSLF